MAAAPGSILPLDAFLDIYIPRLLGDATENEPARHASTTITELYARRCIENVEVRQRMYVAQAITLDLVRKLVREHESGRVGQFVADKIFVIPATGELCISIPVKEEVNVGDEAYGETGEDNRCDPAAIQAGRRRDMYNCAQIILAVYERFLESWIPKLVWEWVNTIKQVPEAERYSTFLEKVSNILEAHRSFDPTMIRAARALFSADNAAQAFTELAAA